MVDERKYLHQFESISPDDSKLNQSIITLSVPVDANNIRLRTILLSELLSSVNSQIFALTNALAALETAINEKEPAGDYALKADLEAYQPVGDYAPLMVVEYFTDHIQSRGDGSHIPDSGITNSLVAPDAAIAWTKISKLNANPADIGALPAKRGFHYYQANVPSNPLVGERWAELDNNEILIDEWVYNGARWIAPYSLTVASPQVNINTYPAASFWGYLGTKYDVLIEKISLNYNQASGFVAGSTYCSAKFQLTGTQYDQTNTTILGNYREIGIVNQASSTGSTSLDINKIFVTSPIHYAIGCTVTKVGTGTTTMFYASFGIQYRWVRKV